MKRACWCEVGPGRTSVVSLLFILIFFSIDIATALLNGLHK